MSDFFVYLKVDGYLQEWLVRSYGYPVRFPSGSFENAILRHNLQKKSEGCGPDLPAEGRVPVAIPDSRTKPPIVYNYLGRRGRYELLRSLDMIFCIDLWNGLRVALCGNRLNESIGRWCLRKGISEGNIEAVRQKFYRMRRNYERYGVFLGKKHARKVV